MVNQLFSVGWSWFSKVLGRLQLVHSNGEANPSSIGVIIGPDPFPTRRERVCLFARKKHSITEQWKYFEQPARKNSVHHRNVLHLTHIYRRDITQSPKTSLYTRPPPNMALVLDMHFVLWLAAYFWLIDTRLLFVGLRHSRATDSSLALVYCARYQVFLCMYVCMCVCMNDWLGRQPVCVMCQTCLSASMPLAMSNS